MSSSLIRGFSASLFTPLFLVGCACATAPMPDKAPEPVRPVEAVQPEPVTVRPVEPKPVVPEESASQVASPPATKIFYFDFDSSELSGKTLDSLTAHARYLRENPQARVTISGHCDARGPREYNLALGERRAAAARDYLQARGVRSSQISTVSFGEEFPVAPGNTEAAWAKNRRVALEY